MGGDEPASPLNVPAGQAHTFEPASDERIGHEIYLVEPSHSTFPNYHSSLRPVPMQAFHLDFPERHAWDPVLGPLSPRVSGPDDLDMVEVFVSTTTLLNLFAPAYIAFVPPLNPPLLARLLTFNLDQFLGVRSAGGSDPRSRPGRLRSR